MDEWLGLFDDPILGNSALGRLAYTSYQIVIEGTSYRQRLSPHRRKEGHKGALTPPDDKWYNSITRVGQRMWLTTRCGQEEEHHGQPAT